MSVARRARLVVWGENIRTAREAAGRTQEWLAEKLGVATTTVYRWETGKIAPTDDHKAAIAVALDAEARSLFPLDLGAVPCTPLSARWCPVHGSCRCGKTPEDQDSTGAPLDLDDPLCALHAPSGPHHTDHPRPFPMPTTA